MWTSVKSFFEGRGGFIKVAVILAVGLVLVLFGVSGGGEEDAAVKLSAEEEKIAEICSSVEGVGECRAAVYYETVYSGYRGEENTKISGIAVVCRGGESYETKEKVIKLLSSLYGIGSNRITVEKMTD